MTSERSLITHQWLLCSALLLLGALLSLPSNLWPLLLIPLLFMGKALWRLRPPGRLTLTALFILWLGCFAMAS